MLGRGRRAAAARHRQPADPRGRPRDRRHRVGRRGARRARGLPGRRRAHRRRRPGAVRREAPRPQPRLPVHRGDGRRPGGGGAGGRAPRAGGVARRERAAERARRRARSRTPSTSRSWRRASRRSSACRPRACCCAASAAGCTTSARARCPDELLAKRGPLDDERAALMRMHPIVGEQLVRRIGGLEDAAPILRHHHERFDGSGYPDGLRGDAIPIEARIVGAAEAYSSMTSGHIYRPQPRPVRRRRRAVPRGRRAVRPRGRDGALQAVLAADAERIRDELAIGAQRCRRGGGSGSFRRVARSRRRPTGASRSMRTPSTLVMASSATHHRYRFRLASRASSSAAGRARSAARPPDGSCSSSPRRRRTARRSTGCRRARTASGRRARHARRSRSPRRCTPIVQAKRRSPSGPPI